MAYNDYLKIRTWSLDGSRTANITEQLGPVTWSGSYADCARKLSFSALPEALGETGGLCRLYLRADCLFSGTIQRRERDSAGKMYSCTAYDRGIFLKRNQVYRKYRRMTPEAVAAQLCGEFGVETGALAATGVALDRNFLGSSLYQVIQTLYTLAAEQTGKQYQVRFRKDVLEVVEKALGAESIRLLPGSNLLGCSSVESMENMVTSVAVYDDEMRLKAAYDSPDGLRALYGLFQAAIQAKDKDDPAQSAKQLLEDNGIQTTLTADCLGNAKLISGNAVVLHEPTTGADGLFWITSDTHTLSGGIYRTKVVLDFRCLMDEQTAGSVPAE